MTTKRYLSRAESNAFKDAIAVARSKKDVEKAVENAFNNVVTTFMKKRFNKGYTVTNTYPHNTDGVVTVSPTVAGLSFDDGAVGEFSVLIEVKKDMNLSGSKGRKDRSTILSQVVYYLHKFVNSDNDGRSIPSVIIVADNDEAFAVQSSHLMGFVDKMYAEDPDWAVAPSSAAGLNNTLFTDIMGHSALQSVYVEDITSDTFDIEEFLNRVVGLGTGSTNKYLVRLSSKNIEKVFLKWMDTVGGGQRSDTTTHMSLMLRSFFDMEHVYLNRNNKNMLMVEQEKDGNTVITSYPHAGSSVQIHGDGFMGFFTKYQRGGYLLAERKELTAIGDMLIEDFDRRFTGDFWTPKVWADEAFSMIVDELGEDWTEKYTVWDPACGTKNLTRDHKFKNLYCSTLHQSELDLSQDYNPEATTFQYDFLNDDVDGRAVEMVKFFQMGKSLRDMNDDEKCEFLENIAPFWKLPKKLLAALVFNRPMVFFGNPPYGQATNQGDTSKSDIAKTKVGDIMRAAGLGHASSELYTQFIYRVQQLADVFSYDADYHFFFFNKGFLTSPNFGKFTKNLCSRFQFKNGFMMNAGEFNGTSATWGIIFAHWALDKTASMPERFEFAVMERSINNMVEEVGKWNGHPIDKKNVISAIIPTPIGSLLPKGSTPSTKNGFEKTTGVLFGRDTTGSLGYMRNSSNSVQFSDKYLCNFTIVFNNGGGTPVDAGNFQNAAVVFSVRKAWLDRIADQKLLWVRDKDIFPKPSDSFMKSKEWTNFQNDCVVYSLFANGSRQTSLRGYEYGTESDGTPKRWDIKNQFFWNSLSKMQELAGQHNVKQMELDADRDTDRHVHNFLKSQELSEESKNLLEVVNKILEESMKYRVAFSLMEDPKYNLLTWDAGWFQIYTMCYSQKALPAAKNDQKLQELYAEFLKCRKVLGEKIADKYSEDTGF